MPKPILVYVKYVDWASEKCGRLAMLLIFMMIGVLLLDAITRNRLNEELLELHAQSKWTAFFVTHSVNEAVFLSHRIIIMGGSPGQVARVIENPLPFPRDAHTRESIEFQQQVGTTTASLQEVLDQ